MAKILIVDDEKSICDLITEILSMGGHTCDQAFDGLKGLVALRNKPYDLVILDRSMPEMTGIDVLKLIRGDEKLKSIKVVICTASEMMDQVQEALSAGADDYIIKPLDVKKLTDKIERQLQK